jgi:hypothetical protein|nr:MAG TPA_asm: hypothetical protein [Caudoviricetes sp.]
MTEEEKKEQQGTSSGEKEQQGNTSGEKEQAMPAPPQIKKTSTGYDSLIEKLKSKEADYSDEERRKIERKKKRDKLFSAIGDGVSALSSLYFTTQYAPPTYDGNKSSTARTNARYDKLLGEFDANKKDYYNSYARLLALQAAADNRDNINIRSNYKTYLDALRRDKEARRKAEEKDKDREAKKEIAGMNNATKKEVAEKKGSGGSGSGGKRAEYVAYDENDNPHYFTFKAAQEQFAKQHGTWEYSSSTGYKLDEEGTKQRVSSGGYARTPQEQKPKKRTKRVQINM